MTDGGHLENQKRLIRYLQNHIADFDKILHDDTY